MVLWKWYVKESKHFKIITGTFTTSFIFCSFQIFDFCHEFWHLLHILFSPNVTNSFIPDFNNSKGYVCGICIRMTIFNSFYGTLLYWLEPWGQFTWPKLMHCKCKLSGSTQNIWLLYLSSNSLCLNPFSLYSHTELLTSQSYQVLILAECVSADIRYVTTGFCSNGPGMTSGIGKVVL